MRVTHWHHFLIGDAELSEVIPCTKHRRHTRAYYSIVCATWCTPPTMVGSVEYELRREQWWCRLGSQQSGQTNERRAKMGVGTQPNNQRARRRESEAMSTRRKAGRSLFVVCILQLLPVLDRAFGCSLSLSLTHARAPYCPVHRSHLVSLRWHRQGHQQRGGFAIGCACAGQ